MCISQVSWLKQLFYLLKLKQEIFVNMYAPPDAFPVLMQVYNGTEIDKNNLSNLDNETPKNQN